MRTEAWWCCTCGAKINRVGKPRRRGPDGDWESHLRVCPITDEIERSRKSGDTRYILQGMHIVQVPQGKAR